MMLLNRLGHVPFGKMEGGKYYILSFGYAARHSSQEEPVLAEIWFNWVERDCNMVTRMSFSQKTMEWWYTLSRNHRRQSNFVMLWKYYVHFSEYLCARNFNRYGRYISIINAQGKRRTVIIVPERSFNTGWMDIATKILNFIKGNAQKAGTIFNRNIEDRLLYADTVRNNKWTTREINIARIRRKSGSLIISEAKAGSLPEEIPDITLSEVRRWAASNWKQAHGVNIY
ncbi:hypothetical protein H5410_055533 [Solanum commersonii]|uniref:Uncharacterized protein n=1 Tax=Solanum commersonii TaxID=4109 RepID=A0A9J5WJE5_SOLCO|nr:hypothetical protein H5410_055533 [Solanum commersonii]